MLGYIMALQSQLAEAESEAVAPAADTSSTAPQNQPGDLQRLRVAVTGAFLTGHPLAVRLDSYDILRRQLGKTLKEPHWQVEDLRGRPGTYASGGGFSEETPLVIARREGYDLLPVLRTALRQDGASLEEPLERFAPLIEATPGHFVVDVYDLGVAVMTAWLDIVVAGDVDLDTAARAVKRLSWLRADGGPVSPLVVALQQIASAVSQQYGEAVLVAAPAELQAAAWLSRAAGQAGSAEGRPEESGRLLWLHPVHIHEVASAAARSSIAELAPAFHDTIELEGGIFAAGIGSSAVVVSGRRDAAETPVQLILLHWAYYALYMEIDRGLLRVLNQQRWNERASLKDLEADARHAFADYLRVMDARARLDSTLSARGGDELAIWEIIAKVQRFDVVVDAVERKLEILDKVAQRRVVEATEDRARRLSKFAGFFTVLTVVTVTIAVIGATVGSVSSGGISSFWLRVAVVATASVLSCVLWWLFFVRSTRIPPPRSKRR